MKYAKPLGAILILVAIVIAAAWFINKPEQGAAGGMLSYPLSRFEERPKLLTFGLFVTPNPDQNPIDPPERFVGYHTALDLETFDEEQAPEVDVEVKAICDGTMEVARTADGYGGVLVQSCRINDQDVTVLYGHLDPQSFTKQQGQAVARGERLAILGDEKSAESGFTRKHLHLGIHKGKDIVLLGYVQSQAELENYMDPLPLIQP
jgi:murein DD-endopeptidase MepM/ murein hydrolase activator NlpD